MLTASLGPSGRLWFERRQGYREESGDIALYLGSQWGPVSPGMVLCRGSTLGQPLHRTQCLVGRGFLLRGHRTSCLSLAQSEGQGGCCQSWQNQRFWEVGLWIQVWRGMGSVWFP